MHIIIPGDKETYKDYINRILNCRENKRDEDEYQEVHHILPKCQGGDNAKNNLIYLYAQEHYFCHKLLALENSDVQDLQYAWWNMCHVFSKGREYDVSPEDYAESRKRFAELSSVNNSGSNSYWYNRKQSNESNEKRSQSLKGEKNPMYGKTHTKDVKDSISKNNKGKRTGGSHPRSRKVKCLNTGEIFNTAVEAAKHYGLKSRSSITLCCRKDKDSAGKDPISNEKLRWEYVNC